jgi:hypothetical protein
MVDSDALRSRRKRAHTAGDHHLCRHWPVPTAVSRLPAPDPSNDLDPAAEMRLLAGRLSAAYTADPGNAALARELRVTLLAVGGQGMQGADPVLAGLLETFRGESQDWPDGA